MDLPPEIIDKLDVAHRAFQAHRDGSGTLHDSSTATVAARDALMGWAMNIIYTVDPQPTLSSLIEDDNTSAAMKVVLDRQVARHIENARRSVA